MFTKEESMLLTMAKPSESADLDTLQVRFGLFKPKLEFEIIVGNFLIRTARTAADLKGVVQMRQHSFLEDFLPNQQYADFDFDDYDVRADHILVKHVPSGEVIGSYRIICTLFSDKFYNFEEFNIDGLLKKPGVKVELSRACIHKNYRNGSTLNLVWRGISQYVKAVNAQYIFGCSSVKSISPRLCQSMFWQLYPMFYTDVYSISVLPQFQFNQTIEEKDILPMEVVDEQIPPLLKSYLKAGAKICSAPALDMAFRCVDFLTVLDLNEVTDSYRKRYFSR
jgi:putative hemolysin